MYIELHVYTEMEYDSCWVGADIRREHSDGIPLYV